MSDMKFVSFKDLKKDTIECFNQFVSFLQRHSYAGYFTCDHDRDVNLFTRNVIWVYKNQLIPEVITSTLEDSCFNEMERYCTVEYQFFTHDFEKEYSV